MNVLLTGASGFIGRQVAQDLDCTCAVRNKNRYNSNRTVEIENITGDTDWGEKLSNIDAVIHLAGIAHNPMFPSESPDEVNVNGTLQLANVASLSGVKRFVFVSSIGVNGPCNTNNEAFSTESDVNPCNYYAISKLTAEEKLKNFCNITGMELVIVRPTLVYGANAPGNFGRLVKLISQFKMLPFGLVSNRRDFISVQNLSSLLIECVRNPKAPGNIFLATDGSSVSTKEFTNAIAKGLKINLIQVPIPTWLMSFALKIMGKEKLIEQLLMDLRVDTSETEKLLGWRAPLSMSQAMEELSTNK